MGKVYENEDVSNKLSLMLGSLKSTVENMEEDRGEKFIEWMEIRDEYLKREVGFEPERLRRYKAGEIVYANLGFNVGAEYGGLHYAVVLRDSPRSNPIINVVPLTSHDINIPIETIHPSNLPLGVIPGLNGKFSVALPNQLRPISKVRVYRPRRPRDRAACLSDELFEQLKAKIREIYIGD